MTTYDENAKLIEGYDRYTITRAGLVYDTEKQRLLTVSTVSVNVNKSYKMTHLADGSGKYTKVYLHRLLATAFIPNPDNLDIIDHKDTNSLNNELGNLRWVSHTQNMQNRKPTLTSTSKFMGVAFHKQAGKWVAQITVDKTKKYLGIYDHEIDAAFAYDAAALAAGIWHHNGLIEPKIFSHYAQ